MGIPETRATRLLKIKLFRVGSLGTRLMRAPLAHSPPTTHGSALVPLDTANSRKLLYSNPRLLHSSPLGETCPPPCRCKAPPHRQPSQHRSRRPPNAARPGCTLAQTRHRPPMSGLRTAELRLKKKDSLRLRRIGNMAGLVRQRVRCRSALHSVLDGWLSWTTLQHYRVRRQELGL